MRMHHCRTALVIGVLNLGYLPGVVAAQDNTVTPSATTTLEKTDSATHDFSHTQSGAEGNTNGEQWPCTWVIIQGVGPVCVPTPPPHGNGPHRIAKPYVIT